MKNLKVMFLLTMLLGVSILGCQKKDAIEDPIIEIEEEDPPIDEPDEMPEEADEILVSLPGATEQQQEYDICMVNFIIINNALRKMLIETYVMANVVGMPGFHGGADSRNSCPESSLTDMINYPTTLVLDYTTAGCSPATGLTVAGILEVDFSGPIDQADTEITLRPNADFSVSGHNINVSDPQALKLNTEDGFSYELSIATGENISVTNTNGGVTQATSIGPNVLLYDDNGTNSDPTDILDDVFTFDFEDLETQCGNGSSLVMQSTEPLVYDLTCDCIQDGIVESYEDRAHVQTVDFGYPAVDGEEGVCDDEILVTDHITERDSDEVIACP